MSLLKFDEIVKNDFFNFKHLVIDIDTYLAHLSKDCIVKETLLEHSNLVLEYAFKLIAENELEKNINKIIGLSTQKKELRNDIKLFYLKAIYWHDIGKINENFQIDKMNNNRFKSIKNGISSKHSILSAYLYLLSCFEYINKNYQNPKDKIELISVSIYFSLALWRHHTGLSASWKEFLNGSEGIKICNNLYEYTSKLTIKIDKKMHQVLTEYLKNMVFDRNEEYYILSKSLFSLLIISDYYATAQFMNYGNKKGLVYSDFGLIDEKFRNKIYQEFYKNQYLDDIENKKESDFKDFKQLQEKSNENLNHLRNKLFVEVRKNLRENIDKNLFYIEAPTGAGKTNLSIMCAVEILKHDKNINKIFYVFPFTTLITQTYDSVKKVLNLDDSQIVELHSKAKYNDKKEIAKDGVYADEKTNFLDNLFMNYPIVLISHVKFFDILTGTNKEDNYIFHRLANSIVIIDEIQTYSPDLWSKIVYMLDSFATKFNIKFIVMSATLPKIGKILAKEDIDDKFVKLVEHKESYFANPNFANRVIEVKEIKENTDEKLYKKLIKESKIYQKLESNKTKKVKTIIEFITKKGADKFYQYAKEHNKIFDEIFILSGTILEPRRREIINILKNTDDKNILLVTTQVVEAGVDIDMDIGFKEKSLVDSDEQLAGRINRNSLKDGNKLFLFEMERKNSNFVYKRDKRLKIQKENNLSLLKIEGKNFDNYYDKVIEKIKGSNEVSFIENLDSYVDHIKNLRFNETHIKIIDIESISIFVPINNEAIEIWEEYKKIIQNQEIDFTQRQIQLQNLASKLSKYTFSLAIYRGSGIDYLKPYGVEEFGYLYLEEYENIYSYKDGLDTKVLSGENIPLII
jgi:CRISPR-associated endonuclease/helicase Cas3